MIELEPIEPFLRQEALLDDITVVLRGGPIAAAKIVEHALREARAHSFQGKPLHSVSVSLTIDDWTLDDVLAGPLASRSTYAVSTVVRLRNEGLLLLPTYTKPHYDLVLNSPHYDEAERLLNMFSHPLPNPHKRRR